MELRGFSTSWFEPLRTKIKSLKNNINLVLVDTVLLLEPTVTHIEGQTFIANYYVTTSIFYK